MAWLCNYCGGLHSDGEVCARAVDYLNYQTDAGPIKPAFKSGEVVPYPEAFRPVGQDPRFAGVTYGRSPAMDALPAEPCLVCARRRVLQTARQKRWRAKRKEASWLKD